jgi:hypothetical protein
VELHWLPAACVVLASTRTLRLREMAGVNAFCRQQQQERSQASDTLDRVWCTEKGKQAARALAVRAALKAFTCVLMPHLSAMVPNQRREGFDWYAI